MCQCSGETMDHLLLHCEVAYILSSVVFKMFGTRWVLSSMVADLLFSWRNWFGKHWLDVRILTPLCLKWIVWKERNRCTFKDFESSLDQLQSLLIQALFDWSHMLSFTHCNSVLEFQDSLCFLYDYMILKILCVSFIIVKLKQSSLLIKFITYRNINNNPRGRRLSFTEHIRSLVQHFIHGKKFMLQYSLVYKKLFISTLNKQQKGQNYYKVW